MQSMTQSISPALKCNLKNVRFPSLHFVFWIMWAIKITCSIITKAFDELFQKSCREDFIWTNSQIISGCIHLLQPNKLWRNWLSLRLSLLCLKALREIKPLAWRQTHPALKAIAQLNLLLAPSTHNSLLEKPKHRRAREVWRVPSDLGTENSYQGT